jgi:hypothetical protein
VHVRPRHLISVLLAAAAVVGVTFATAERNDHGGGPAPAARAAWHTHLHRPAPEVTPPRGLEHTSRVARTPTRTRPVGPPSPSRRRQAARETPPVAASPAATPPPEDEPTERPEPPLPAIADVRVTSVDASDARISWLTTVPTRGLAAVGLDEPSTWAKPDDELAVEHVSTLDGLEPGTDYQAYLHAVDAEGRAATAEASFTTGPAPVTSTASTEGDDIVVDGRAFFPTAVWQQCSDALGASVDDGINLFIGLGCHDDDVALPRLLAGRAYALVDAEHADATGRGLIGWHYPDELDASLDGSIRRDQLRAAVDPRAGRISFLTLTNHFYSRAEPLPQGRGMYPVLLSLPDVVGFDLYPLQGWCRPAFGDVFDAQRELDQVTGGKPTFQWLEVAAMEQECGRDRTLDPTPTTVRAETWLAIAGGADGVGYFPNRWGVAIGAELARTNRTIKALAPALDAPELPARSDADAVRVATRSRNGAIYVIAVNTTDAAVHAQISVPGIEGRSVHVYGGGDAIGSDASSFGDVFGPLAAHVYVVPPAGW